MLTLQLELWRTICSLMDKCVPLRSIRMSSGDPSWMSPLVRSTLRAKTRVWLNNREPLKLRNSIISQVISENRRNPASVMGSRVWWKNVDLFSQHHARTSCVNFDHAPWTIWVNNYFGCLWHDDSYLGPTDVLIKGHVEVPEITQRQVWNVLTKLKRTATGPDNIPFWIWKDHVELFTPVITQVWNLSSWTHSCPVSGREGEY